MQRQKPDATGIRDGRSVVAELLRHGIDKNFADLLPVERQAFDDVDVDDAKHPNSQVEVRVEGAAKPGGAAVGVTPGIEHFDSH